jgi:hypothetical protein
VAKKPLSFSVFDWAPSGFEWTQRKKIFGGKTCDLKESGEVNRMLKNLPWLEF